MTTPLPNKTLQGADANIWNFNMKKRRFNPDNERCKREYFLYLKNVKGYCELTLDAIRAAICSYEEYTEFSGLKSFSKVRAIAYKEYTLNEKNKNSGESLSKSTVSTRLRHVQQFFKWLSGEKGYKSVISPTDADYLNMTKKDRNAARATRQKRIPTLDEFEQVLFSMPHDTDIEKRNRALIAFIGISGVRVTAITSLKRKHIDIDKRAVFQYPLEVKTKFSKEITTYLFPISEGATLIFRDWVQYLDSNMNWHAEFPLFPRTTSAATSAGNHKPNRALTTEHWSAAGSIREIVKSAFKRAGVDYCNPHSFRDMLVSLALKNCRTPEEIKACSQNLGHSHVRTTLESYGEVPDERQAEIILKSFNLEPEMSPFREIETKEIAAELDRRLRDS